MKTNHQMDVLYDEILEENLDDSKALPQKLLALLNGGFVEEEQCVSPSLSRKAAPVKRMDIPDRTAYECFVNHIHIEDYLENGGLPPLEMLGRGIALARELNARLSQLHGTSTSVSSSRFLARPARSTPFGLMKNGSTRTPLVSELRRPPFWKRRSWSHESCNGEPGAACHRSWTVGRGDPI